MTHRDQKRREKFHLELFWQFNPALLPTKPIPADPPAPDALMTLSDRTIGIELTTFFCDATSAGGSPSRALHALRNRVVEHAARTSESRQMPSVDVVFTWQDRENLSASEPTTIAEQLVELVARNLPNLDAHIIIAFPNPGWKELPKHVAAVFVSRPAGLTRSTWNFSQGGSVPHLRDTFGRLQEILDDKEPKILGYRRRCDEVWLLMVADASTMNSFVVVDEEDEPPPHRLISSFDRLFLLSVVHRRAVELSLSKPQ